MKRQALFAARANGPADRRRPALLRRLVASLRAAFTEPEPKRGEDGRRRDGVFQPPKY